MDFHSISRRDLQALCKKNRIPANMTNAAMADALQALQTVEGIGETPEALQYQSPKKPEARSPDLPRTGRRTSARRCPVRDGPKEGQASPLPRSRRVTAKALEIMTMVAKGEGDGNQEDLEEEKSMTPAAFTGQKTRAPTTRRRVSKKEEGEEEEVKVGGEKQEGAVEIPPTPASRQGLNTRKRVTKKEEVSTTIPDTPAMRTGRKTSVRRVADTPVAEEKEAMQLRTRRSTRKLQPEETMTDARVTAGKKSTRARIAPKMASLGQETEEREGKDIAGDEVSRDGETKDQNKDSDELQMGETKPSDPMGTVTSDLGSSDPEAKMEALDPTMEGEAGKQDLITIQESRDSTPQDQNQEVEDDESNGDREPAIQGLEAQEGDLRNAISASEDSPIRGLVDYSREEDGARGSDQKKPCTANEGSDGALIEQMRPLDGTPEEENSGVDLDFHPQETTFSDENPAEIEDSGHHSPVIQTACPQDNVEITTDAAIDIGIPRDIPATSDQCDSETLSSDGFGDRIGKEANTSLDRLFTSKVAGVDLIPNQAPETGIKESGDDLTGETVMVTTEESGVDYMLIGEAASSPLHKAPSSAMSPAEVGDPICNQPEPGDDLSGEILEDSKDSGGDVLESECVLEDPSSHLQQVLPLNSSVQSSEAAKSPAKSPAEAEVRDPICDLSEPDDYLTSEISEESSTGKLLNTNLTPPESESILEDCSSPHLPSLNPSIQNSEAARSPAKVGDLICNRPEQDVDAGEIMAETKQPVANLLPITNQTPLESESIIEAASFSSQPVPSSDPSSDAAISPAKVVGDLICSHPPDGFTAEAPAGTSPKTIVQISDAGGLGKGNLLAPVGIYRDGSEDRDVDKEDEDEGADGLTRGGEVKVKVKAKKLNPQQIYYSRLSMRKLRAIYKGKLNRMKSSSSSKDEVEGKRTALTALDENCL